jgi:hypothetical protein
MASQSPNGREEDEHCKDIFEFCLSNEWIARNPARLVKNQRGRDAADRRSEQKLPFTDSELPTFGGDLPAGSDAVVHLMGFGPTQRN